MKNVYIANDHAAVDLKNELCDYIESLGFHVINLGTDEKTSVNYPEYAEKAAKEILEHIQAIKDIQRRTVWFGSDIQIVLDSKEEAASGN